MAIESLRVYLDSSDFSTLSGVGRSSEHESIRQRLMAWSETGAIQFVFSGAHLIEMAPLDAGYTQAAAARTDLLVGLCHRNAMISFDRLIAAEIRNLCDPSAPVPTIFSAEADWYPEIQDIISPVSWIDAMKSMDDAVKEHGLNRMQRRRWKQAMFKHGQPKKDVRQFLFDSEESGDYRELVERYPMRLQDARLLGKYAIGRATAKQAENAFLESLRDPRWMMRWFANHHSELSPLIQWLRDPAKRWKTALEDFADAARQVHQLRSVLGPRHGEELLSAEGWQRHQEETLLKTVNAAAVAFSLTIGHQISNQDIDAFCPGTSVFIRSTHSAARDVTGLTPRGAKASDLFDGVHATYAPYVDVFRADTHMANHIQRFTEQHGTTVVPRLTQLVSVIEARLRTA